VNERGTKAASKGRAGSGGDVRPDPPPRAITFEVGIKYLLTDGELPKTDAKRKVFIEDLEAEIDDVLHFALVERFGRGRIASGNRIRVVDLVINEAESRPS